MPKVSKKQSGFFVFCALISIILPILPILFFLPVHQTPS